MVGTRRNMDRTLTRILLARSCAAEDVSPVTEDSELLLGWVTGSSSTSSRPSADLQTTDDVTSRAPAGCLAAKHDPVRTSCLSYDDLLTNRCVDRRSYHYIPDNGAYAACKATARAQLSTQRRRYGLGRRNNPRLTQQPPNGSPSSHRPRKSTIVGANDHVTATSKHRPEDDTETSSDKYEAVDDNLDDVAAAAEQLLRHLRSLRPAADAVVDGDEDTAAADDGIKWTRVRANSDDESEHSSTLEDEDSTEDRGYDVTDTSRRRSDGILLSSSCHFLPPIVTSQHDDYRDVVDTDKEARRRDARFDALSRGEPQMQTRLNKLGKHVSDPDLTVETRKIAVRHKPEIVSSKVNKRRRRQRQHPRLRVNVASDLEAALAKYRHHSAHQSNDDARRPLDKLATSQTRLSEGQHGSRCDDDNAEREALKEALKALSSRLDEREHAGARGRVQLSLTGHVITTQRRNRSVCKS